MVQPKSRKSNSITNGVTVGSDQIPDTVVVSEARGQEAYEIILRCTEGNPFMTTAVLVANPHDFKDKQWVLSHGVRVETHPYDDTLYAFEVTQQKRCLGTIIPLVQKDMERLRYILDNDLSLDGIKCNDEFGTLIRVHKTI